MEDNPGDALLVETALGATRWAFDVARADTLAGALANLGNDRFDAVLLDLHLPDSNGTATFTRVRATAPELPVVVLTGLDDDSAAVAALRGGAQDYLVKKEAATTAVARAVVHAVERQRLVGVISRTARHRDALAVLGQRALEVREFTSLAAAVGSLITEVLGVDLAGCALQDPETGRLQLFGDWGPAAVTGDATVDPSTFPGVVVERNEALVLGTDGSIFEAGDHSAALSAACVPVRDGDRAVGAVAALASLPRAFESTEIDLLHGVANVVGQAWRRASAEGALAGRVRELSALLRVSRALHTHHDRDAALAIVLEAIVDSLGAPHAASATLTVGGVSRTFPTNVAGGRLPVAVPITVDGVVRGLLTVSYCDDRPVGAAERDLLAGACDVIALWLHRDSALSALRVREQTLGAVAADRERMSRSLRVSQERLRLVLDQLPAALWTTDRSLRVSTALGSAIPGQPDGQAEFLGRTISQITGGSVGEPNPVDMHRAALDGVGQSYAIAWRGASLQCAVHPLRDEDGAITGVVGIALDTTALRETRRALEESQRRLRGLFEHSHDAFLLLGDDGRFVEVNPAMERLTGRSRDELVSLRLDDLSPEGLENRLESLLPGLREGRTCTSEHRVVRADGSVTDILVTAVPNIVPDLHLLTMRDIADRKKAEASLHASLMRERRAARGLREAAEMKNAFLQAVSHELRTPLTSVIGFTTLLKHRQALLDEDRYDLIVDRLAANAHRLEVLLTDLLDIDRITRGALEPKRTEVDVAELTFRVVAELVADPRVQVRAETVTASLDAARVERIVENLVVNALRHAPGQSPVEVSVSRDDDHVEIVVEDRGPGVPDALKPRIFEPFQQGDTEAARVGGAGIGLTVVAAFARLHGGTAEVSDRPDGGASFKVRLPLSVRAAEDGSAASATVRRR